MNIIKLDTEKKDGRNKIASESPLKIRNVDNKYPQNFREKRLSSATKARIEQKQLIQQMLLKSSSNMTSNAITSSRKKVPTVLISSYSPRRDVVKTKNAERPKSSTPRLGRQKLTHGKPYGECGSKKAYILNKSRNLYY